MELKEYIKIFKENIKISLVIIGAIVISAFLYFYLKPISYSTSLVINVTRSGTQETKDYKFDNFYRLQADEKFAETVVQWLKDPRIATDIFQEAGIKTEDRNLSGLAKIFKAEKLSSQIVSVSFSSANPDTAKKISQAITKIISQKTESLNIEQKETFWFKIISFDPVIILDKINPFNLLVFSFLAGLFIAFWAILIIHYLK